MEGALTYSTQQNTSTSIIGELSFPLQYKSYARLFDNEFLSSITLSGLLPSKKTTDGGSQIIDFIFAFPLVIPSASELEYYVGPALHWQQIKGSGGTITVNNGAGYATADLPNSSSSSKIFSIYLGMGWMITESLRSDLAMLWDSPLQSRNRYSFLYTITVPL